MRVESGSGRDLVVVVDEEETVMRVVGVPVIAERERMTGVEPANSGVGSIIGASDVDEGEGPDGMRSA